MSILLPDGKDWLASNWISMGFFEDCLPHLSAAPELAADIRFCVDAEVDTLDLRDKSAAEVQELRALIALVLENNQRFQGRNFAAPEQFPLYLNALTQLQTVVGGQTGMPLSGGG